MATKLTTAFDGVQVEEVNGCVDLMRPCLRSPRPRLGKMMQATAVALAGSGPAARETKRIPSELMDAERQRGACGG